MSIVLDEGDFVRASLGRKVLGKKPAAPQADDEVSNVQAMQQLVEAIKGIIEKPQPSLQPVVDALLTVQETQARLLRLLEQRREPDPVRNWEFTVEHDSHGDVKKIVAKGE